MLLGVVAIVVVGVSALLSDDPLNFLAVPIVAIGVIVVVGAIFLFALMAQGVSDFRRRPDE